jgi:hypothetical protein
MRSKELQLLENPLFGRYCQGPRTAVQTCLEGTHHNDCTKVLAASKHCEDTLRKAYRHVNMAKCVYEIQALTICQVEWCDDENKNSLHEDSAGSVTQSCQKKCKNARETLDACTKGHVQFLFQKLGVTNVEGRTVVAKKE